MSYEPGSLECRYLIEAKENILSTIKSLKNIKSVDSINNKLLLIYKEIDEMHEKRKVIENDL